MPPRTAAVLVVVLATLGGCVGRPAPSPGPGLDTRDQPALPVTVPGLDSCATISQEASAGLPDNSEKRLPGLSLPCLTPGPAVDLPRIGGRPTVVNLWATWCPPCRQEMPALQAAHDTYSDVQFLGVATKDRTDWVQEFLPLVKASYPQVVDTDGQLLAELRSPGLPVTVVMDRSGTIVGRQTGKISETRLKQLIAQARG